MTAPIVKQGNLGQLWERVAEGNVRDISPDSPLVRMVKRRNAALKAGRIRSRSDRVLERGPGHAAVTCENADRHLSGTIRAGVWSGLE